MADSWSKGYLALVRNDLWKTLVSGDWIDAALCGKKPKGGTDEFYRPSINTVIYLCALVLQCENPFHSNKYDHSMRND